MSNTIKLQTLAVVLAFLVGCGATEQNIVFSYNKIDTSMLRLDGDGNFVILLKPREVLLSRNVPPVAATDLMDITFSGSVAPVPNQIIGPYDQDRWPAQPFEQPIFFPPPTRVRVEKSERDEKEVQGWPVLIAVALALLTSGIIRAPKTVTKVVGNALMIIVGVVLVAFCVIIGAHFVPTIAFYLSVRGLIILLDRGMTRLGSAFTHTIQYIGFMLVPSYGPTWLTTPTSAVSMPVLIDAPLAPIAIPPPSVEIPAAWRKDRKLEESWDDEDDTPVPQRTSKDNMIVLITLIRIRTLRQEMEDKLAELEALEAAVRHIQANK